MSADFPVSISDQIVYTEEIERRPARVIPNDLRLPASLLERMPAELYSHQYAAIRAAREGKDVLIATGTSSGKSLCFQIPALAACVEEPMARALFLYPTKALAQDQMGRLQAMASDLSVRVSTYDGDTPKSHRSGIRNLCNIVLTNPDMLHLSILPGHANWTKFLKSLRVIALDEMHSYRGVFGSHVALILRRLLRLCAWYHNRPQIIAGSATIGNPEELFERLTGRTATFIDDDGSPSGKRSIVFLNPPLLPNQERLSSNVAASEALATLVETGTVTLAFNRSRIATELVLRYTRKRLDESLADKVESYRAGYTPKERRQIEQAILKGKLTGLTTTNALELGIDIGNLDAVILNTYPGSQSSFWQQIGRAGRGTKDSLALYIAGDNPLEQYLLDNPEKLLNGRNEAVTIQPANPNILGPQLLCAAYERPLAPSECDLFGETALEVAEEKDRAGELMFQSGHFYYPGFEPPALKVNIRGVGGDMVSLTVGGEELGNMEYGRALRQAHVGAIYLHRGEPFEVTEFDLDRMEARLQRFGGNYYTQAKVQTFLEPGTPFADQGPFSLCGCTVTTQVIGYSKKTFDGDTVMDVMPLELPAQSFDTVCLRIDLPPIDMENYEIQASGVHGVEHSLLSLAPLFAACDPNDLGSAWYAMFHETMCPAVFIYDQTPGGIGLAEALFRRADELLDAAIDRVGRCECQGGCPGCLFLASCEVGNEALDKTLAYGMLLKLKALTKG
ncbi:MAG: DEAD/DEAH box helicase [Armatimonadetes bacterium]|nr:DEAD/DEAH box helicase [Armatimonadota bacterium]